MGTEYEVMFCISTILALTATQMLYLTVLVVGLFLVFKVLETKWAYKPRKPHKWSKREATGKISPALRKLEQSYRDKVQFYNFWLQIDRLNSEKVPGAFAEVGVYHGHSAKVIHHMAPARTFYLFDTFNGFEQTDLQHEPALDYRFTSGFFHDASPDRAKRYIDGNENVILCPGHFPKTVKQIADTQFAFVHVDADLYKPTIEALWYFYPRLAPGGVLIVHDYNHDWNGINKAIAEFQAEISEPLVEVPDSYGSVMFIRSKMQQSSSISA